MDRTEPDEIGDALAGRYTEALHPHQVGVAGQQEARLPPAGVEAALPGRYAFLLPAERREAHQGAQVRHRIDL